MQQRLNIADTRSCAESVAEGCAVGRRGHDTPPTQAPADMNLLRLAVRPARRAGYACLASEVRQAALAASPWRAARRQVRRLHRRNKKFSPPALCAGAKF